MGASFWASLVWTLMLGLATGNYATTFVHRVPRGVSAITKHPFCAGCGTMLQPKDLFPVFSWLWLKGKCRYCAMPIPSVYFWVEMWTAAIFMAGVVVHGWSEPYILICMGGALAMTLWGIERQNSSISTSVVMALLVTGLLFRTLMDATLMQSIHGMVLGAALPLLYWRIRQGEKIQNGETEPIRFPDAVWLSAAAGAWLGVFGWCVFMLFWGMLRLAGHIISHRSLSATYVIALMGLLLFPFALEDIRHAALAALTEMLR